MISAIEKLEDGTINLTITIPWSRVKQTEQVVIDEFVSQAELPGFRKGKAPKKLVEDKLDKEKIKEEVLKKLLPQTYMEAINEHKLNPIITPLIHVSKVDEGKDWQYVAKTCESPTIELGNYKDSIKTVTAKTKIVIPGKEKQEVGFDEIAKAIFESVKIKIPKLIIDREVDRLLSQMLDEIRRLGMTLDQYLASTGKTTELLRKEYEDKAELDIKLEFALQKIAETEGIKVNDNEITEAINKAKTPEERKNLESNKYLLATVIRQQKTLEFLRSL